MIILGLHRLHARSYVMTAVARARLFDATSVREYSTRGSICSDISDHSASYRNWVASKDFKKNTSQLALLSGNAGWYTQAAHGDTLPASNTTTTHRNTTNSTQLVSSKTQKFKWSLPDLGRQLETSEFQQRIGGAGGFIVSICKDWTTNSTNTLPVRFFHSYIYLF